MEKAIKGQLNEISAGVLDRGITCYKLPRLIFEALGIKPSLTEIVLGVAKIMDGVKMAKARTSIKPDDQLLRLIRVGQASVENITELFDALLKSKSIKSIDWQSLANEENVTDAPSFLLQFLNGLDPKKSDNQSDLWFSSVLLFFRQYLLDDVNSIRKVKDATSPEEKEARLSEEIADSLGISINVRASTDEQEFLLRAAVLKRFAVLTELIMVDNATDYREFPPTYEKLLPSIGTNGILVVSSKLLMDKMFERWSKTKKSKAKKSDFYRYIKLHLDGVRAIDDSHKNMTIDSRQVKKQIQRWESGKYRLKLDKFWSMFDWAFPELSSDDACDSKQPLQILVLLLIVNLFTKLQLTAGTSGIKPDAIVQEFSDYARLSNAGKTDFENWLIKKKHFNMS